MKREPLDGSSNQPSPVRFQNTNLRHDRFDRAFLSRLTSTRPLDGVSRWSGNSSGLCRGIHSQSSIICGVSGKFNGSHICGVDTMTPRHQFLAFGYTSCHSASPRGPIARKVHHCQQSEGSVPLCTDSPRTSNHTIMGHPSRFMEGDTPEATDVRDVKCRKRQRKGCDNMD